MRNFVLYFGIVAALVASCSIQEDNLLVSQPEDVVFHATCEQPTGTRVYVNGSGQVRWTADDRVGIFNKIAYNQEYRFMGETGADEGTFQKVNPEETPTGAALDHVVAVYPYQAGASIGTGEALSFTFPAVQTYAAGSFGPGANTMVSVSTGDALQFRNACGYLRLSLYGAGVTVSSITLKGNKGEKIAGNATVTMPLGGVPSVSMASDATTSITLTCTEPVALGASQAQAVDFWFAVPPVTFSEGFTVTIQHQGGLSVKKTENPVTITRNNLSKMAPVEVKLLDTRTYRITHLWLWGGTGPQYGSSSVFDLLTMPDYFNSEDGRGITALLDNYYVLKPDGTFVNYAGADGRNWWFVYSGSKNPENGKDLDLSKFYDVLPRSEGTYSISGSTVTFTRPDNTTSSAAFVGPGSYLMPNTNPALYVHIGQQALMFTITGGHDLWDGSGAQIMYTDYHKIAGNPRRLYIEMEQQPDGFIVPEASCTTDADFKFEEPSSGFDLTSLIGTWNVYGSWKGSASASKPYGLWVLGGSGGDPGFVSPVDKDYNWDATMHMELDNTLAISVTSGNSTTVSGTTTWGAGADGGFWNYLYKNDKASDLLQFYGTDLSQYYDQIPKGSSSFSLDVATLTVTWGDNHQAKVLPPGTHSFVNSKTLEVPTGCFALDFHLQDASIPKTSYQYRDIDRFVFAPIEYVIIFAKE